MRYTQSDTEVSNNTTIGDGVEIDATGVILTNTEAGRIIGGVRLLRGGNTLVNEQGGIVRVANDADPYTTAAAIGSAGADTIINAGLISGRIELGDGNDRYVKSGTGATSYERVDLGAGDDRYENAGEAITLFADGGAGRDSLALFFSGQQAVYGTDLIGFEDLLLSGNGQFVGFSGFSTITLGVPLDFGTAFVQSANPLVDLALAGNRLRLSDSSLRSVAGSAAAEGLEVTTGSAISGRVDLGGGDDKFGLSRFAAIDALPVAPGGGVTGGSGYDLLDIVSYSAGSLSLDLAPFSGFEALALNRSYVLRVAYDVTGANGFSAIDLGSESSVTLRASVSPDANLSGGLGGAITLDAASVIGRYGFPLEPGFDQRTDIVQGDDRLSVALTNRGGIAGEVRFYTGDDLYDGSSGSVGGIVYGNAGNDTLIGGREDNILDGGYGADRLFGGGGADVLRGGPGADLLVGDGGLDTMLGGVGNDSYIVEDAGDRVVELAGEGGDTVYTLVSFALERGSAVEVLTPYDRSLGDPLRLTGNELGQILYGTAGGNVLDGGGGTDVLYGLGGDDAYLVDGLDDQVLEFAGGGADTVYATGSFALGGGSAVETITVYDRATTNALNLAGNEFAQRIIGNNGANGLRSGGGADVLYGLGGDDSFLIDSPDAQVIEFAGGGYDTIYTLTSYTLGADAAVETLAAYDRVATDPLRLTGNMYAERIVGNNGANVITGGRGGGGHYTFYGLGGDDVYLVTGLGEEVIEGIGGGNDTVYTTGTYSLGNGVEVETLTVYDRSTTNPLSLSGNEFTQRLIGNAGTNFLDGGGSTGLLIGLGGDDTYLLRVPGAQVIELAGQGYDTVYVVTGAGAISSFALPAGTSVEVLAAHNDSGTDSLRLIGNELAQTIYGNAAANFLDGGGGADILYGLAGDDGYLVDDARDQVIEFGGGADTVYALVSFALGSAAAVETLTVYDRATTGALDLTGSDTANRIIGNDGGNVLDGRGGADVLYGLGGADTFAFTVALGGGNVDEIVGFTSGVDRIQLSAAIFSGLTPGALAPGAFTAGGVAADAGDRIVYNQATGQLFYDPDGTGATGAVQFATLGAGTALGTGDLVIV